MGSHGSRGESQECLNHLACKQSVEYVLLFDCASYYYQKQIFEVREMSSCPGRFEALLCSSIFNEAVFSLGEKTCMLVNGKCSSWYNEVGDFVVSL